MPLSAGDTAPDFRSSDQDGNEIVLSEVAKKGFVALYFYPKDETPGCTAEAKCFRDNWDSLKSFKVSVIGVSSDTAERHKSFRDHHSLQFPLISDTGRKLRKLYGAEGLIIPARITFLIDGNMKIRLVHNSQLNPKSHVEEIKGFLKGHADQDAGQSDNAQNDRDQPNK